MTVLAKKVVVVPAVAAVEVESFDLVDVQENYGYGNENEGNQGRGPRNSVQAMIVFPTDPPTYRNINAWTGDEYLAVRGTWTDETLRAKIKQILESE
jgi:hypothetical protein